MDLAVILPREILEASAMAGMRLGAGPARRASNPDIPVGPRNKGAVPAAVLPYAPATIRPVVGR